MGRKARYIKELKLEIVKRYLKGMTPNELRYHAYSNYFFTPCLLDKEQFKLNEFFC